MSDNAKVAAAATLKGEIRLDQLVLIGVFGTEEERRAMVRHASGRIETVTMGARVGGRQVVAIDTDAVLLQTSSGTTRLEMPAG